MFEMSYRLARLGIDPTRAARGTADTVIQVNSLDELRQLLNDGSTEEQREALLAALFEGVDQGADPLLERVHRHVFGNAGLSEADHREIARWLPLSVHVTASTDNKVIDSKWDLSTPNGEMRVVVLNDFTMNNGGFVVCYKTPLQFICETLTRNGAPGAPGDFNILGATGAAIPAPGKPVAPGPAQPGSRGQCSSAGIAGPGGGNGSTGATGPTGAPGIKGNDGVPSQFATIRVNNSVSVPSGYQLVIATRSGTGGNGQPGGPGGDGGPGGFGGNGVTCGCTGNAAGSGGNGGAGEAGGPGGPGGNAVNASGNIVVTVRAADLAKFREGGIAQIVPPGTGGVGGALGNGGPGGPGGFGGKTNNAQGLRGATGPAGSTGAQGPGGTQSGQPAKVLIHNA